MSQDINRLRDLLVSFPVDVCASKPEIEENAMGQVIRLPHAPDAADRLEEQVIETQRLSNDQLEQAIARCMEVRRQIGLLLEIAVEAENMIDGVSDLGLQTLLRERRANSHVELIGALARVSSAVELLTRGVSARALAVIMDSNESSDEARRDWPVGSLVIGPAIN